MEYALEAQGTCDVLRKYFQAQTQLRTYDTRHSHDALIAGRRFLPRHINQLITYPHTHDTSLNAATRLSFISKSYDKNLEKYLRNFLEY